MIFKKKKEEKKKNTIIEVLKYVLPFVIALIIFLFIKVVILGRAYEFEDISVSKYISLVGSDKENLIYITSDDCEGCQELEEMFKRVLRGSNIKSYKINITNLNDEDKEKFMNLLDITRESVEAPLVILTKDGEILSTYRTPAIEDNFINYLKDNKLIK